MKWKTTTKTNKIKKRAIINDYYLTIWMIIKWYAVEPPTQIMIRFQNGLEIGYFIWFKDTSTFGGYLIQNPFYTHTNAQAFKIIVDSWKVSLLLLYILWDDRPVFIISASNELLQQEWEYTLLNPDCYSWWISKMQSGREDTLEEQYAINFCFKLGKKYHRNVWNASDSFWTIFHESSISFWVA